MKTKIWSSAEDPRVVCTEHELTSRRGITIVHDSLINECFLNVIRSKLIDGLYLTLQRIQ